MLPPGSGAARAVKGEPRPPAPPFAELAARSNFSFLDGASHPWELAATARVLGYSGLGICDTNTLAGVVRGHVAAREAGIPYAVGCRLRLEDDAEYLAWPTCRASYGRLTALLSRGRMSSPKDDCRLTKDDMLAAAEGWVLAAVSPGDLDPVFGKRFRQEAEALRGRLALPMMIAGAHTLRGDDQRRLAWLAGLAASAGGGCSRWGMSATTSPPAGAWPTCSPPSGSAPRWTPSGRRPSPTPSGGPRPSPRWRCASPATRRRWPTPSACWRRPGASRRISCATSTPTRWWTPAAPPRRRWRHGWRRRSPRAGR